jgi:hypothetical protein
MTDVPSLRLKAFSVKLSLRRVAAFYHQLRGARLMDAVPQAGDLAAAPHLRGVFDEFKELHSRMEALLFDEMTRLALEAEQAVHSYVRAHYGFGPGDAIRLAYPNMGPMQLRVNKVFLQSGTDSDIRVDASFLQPDGSTGPSRWDIYMKGPGEFQLDKIQRREGAENR